MSKELLNQDNHYPVDTLAFLKELLVVQQSHPKAITDAINQFNDKILIRNSQSLDLPNCQDLANMITSSFPDCLCNIICDISTPKIDYSMVKEVLDLLSNQTINNPQTINNINVLQKTTGDFLFGLVLYDDMYISNDILEKWRPYIKNGCDWALIGRYNEINNSQSQLIIEDYNSYLDKETNFILTCTLTNAFSADGERYKQFCFVGSQSFLNTPLILPSIDELSKLDDPNMLKNYKKEYSINL